MRAGCWTSRFKRVGGGSGELGLLARRDDELARAGEVVDTRFRENPQRPDFSASAFASPVWLPVPSALSGCVPGVLSGTERMDAGWPYH